MAQTQRAEHPVDSGPSQEHALKPDLNEAVPPKEQVDTHERYDRSVEIADQLESIYDELLESILYSKGVRGDEALRIGAEAQRRKEMYTTGASTQKNPQEALSKLLFKLVDKLLNSETLGLDFKVGDQVNIELGESGERKIRGQIVKLQLDGKIVVRDEQGQKREYDPELVVKLHPPTVTSQPPAQGETVSRHGVDDQRAEKLLFSEETKADPESMQRAASILGMSETNMEGIKAAFELVKGMIESEGGQMSTYLLPQTWQGFVNLPGRNFFQKLFGQPSKLERTMSALMEAYYLKAAGTAKVPERWKAQVEAKRAKMQQAGTVFHVKT